MDSAAFQSARQAAQAMLPLWGAFEGALRTHSPAGVLYHGDFDGVIGAAAMLLSLRQTPSPSAFWIGTEDYDFRSAKQWVAGCDLGGLGVVDLGIENNPAALASVAASVNGPMFIYDHHVVVASLPLPSNVTLANPTPEGHSALRAPVPSFLFADELLRLRGSQLPDWLLLAALFAEGADEFFTMDAEVLLERCCGVVPRPTAREAFRRTPLARLSVLIRAAFAGSHGNDHRVASHLRSAFAEQPPPEAFLATLESEYGPEAHELSRAISKQVDTWLARLSSGGPNAGVAVVDIQSRFPIAGPVASILRGRLSRTVLAVQDRAGRVSVEIRAPNDSDVNFPEILLAVSARVPLLNHGGHRTAAGAAVRSEHLRSFLEEFARAWETRW